MNPLLGIPRVPLDRPVESNLLLPRLDQGSPARWWRYTGRGIDRAHANTGFNGQIPALLNRLPIPLDTNPGFHPFKIYRLPLGTRVGPYDLPPVGYDLATDWRTVRVRGGNIIFKEEVLNFISPPPAPGGLVGFTLDQGVTDLWCGGAGGPFQPPFTTRGGMIHFNDPRWFGGSLVPTGDYVCALGAVTFFWLSLDHVYESDDSVFSLRISTDPSTFQDMGTGKFIWDNWPTQNPYNRLIGWVDTISYPAGIITGDSTTDPTDPSDGSGYFAVINQVETNDIRWQYPMPVVDYGPWDVNPPFDQGYPFNAQVTKVSVAHSGQTLVWLSSKWFNESDPDTGDGSWVCRGSFPTVSP